MCSSDLFEYINAENIHYIGGFEDRYKMYYLGKACRSFLDITLPKEQVYKIEVIDIWEMTRTVVHTQASEKIRIKLPGKMGLCVLATRV